MSTSKSRKKKFQESLPVAPISESKLDNKTPKREVSYRLQLIGIWASILTGLVGLAFGGYSIWLSIRGLDFAEKSLVAAEISIRKSDEAGVEQQKSQQQQQTALDSTTKALSAMLTLARKQTALSDSSARILATVGQNTRRQSDILTEQRAAELAELKRKPEFQIQVYYQHQNTVELQNKITNMIGTGMRVHRAQSYFERIYPRDHGYFGKVIRMPLWLTDWKFPSYIKREDLKPENLFKDNGYGHSVGQD
ncbi:MAG: hypothetical protein EAZ91_22435 [Cytophagales bacterium]|nr:MAG: hypothetical protein EAZ91_22435 [Cytophagales bacterium]